MVFEQEALQWFWYLKRKRCNGSGGITMIPYFHKRPLKARFPQVETLSDFEYLDEHFLNHSHWIHGILNRKHYNDAGRITMISYS